VSLDRAFRALLKSARYHDFLTVYLEFQEKDLKYLVADVILEIKMSFLG